MNTIKMEILRNIPLFPEMIYSTHMMNLIESLENRLEVNLRVIHMMYEQMQKVCCLTIQNEVTLRTMTTMYSEI